MRRIVPLTTVLTIGLSVALVAGVVSATTAQSGVSEFEAQIGDLRDAAQTQLDAANLASEEGLATMPLEQQLMGPVATHLPAVVDGLREYTAALEELDVPVEYADDAATQVVALREAADALGDAAAAAAVGDDVGTTAGYDAAAEILARLAADVDPDYFDLAFITPFRATFASFKGLDDIELAYLEGVRDAAAEFERRNADAFRAIGRSYPTPADLMRALYEAGAGEAMPAVEEKAMALEPPPRFVDEHAWWLANLSLQADLDRAIGEAARDGDAVAFMATNNRMSNVSARDGLLAGVYPELDPAFGAAAAPGSPLAEQLEPTAAVARDPYGRALFDILRAYAWTDPSGIAVNNFFFPGVTREMQLEAISATADELLAGWTVTAAALAELEPPPAYEDDHATILSFVDEHGARFEALLDAARDGDPDGVFPALEGLREAYCDTASSLSDEIAPATSVYFDASSDLCRT